MSLPIEASVWVNAVCTNADNTIHALRKCKDYLRRGHRLYPYDVWHNEMRPDWEKRLRLVKARALVMGIDIGE